MRHKGKRQQQGFTVQEMLVVVLILVILLSVSAVALVTYVRSLQLAELDNSAKEIFMAAQNRAILLDGGKRLESLVVSDDGNNKLEHVDVIPGSDNTTQITAYYVHCDDAVMGDLLPQESIDPSLWDGDFYITYEPESGSVVDVFYSDKELPVEGDFAAFYTTWRAADRDARKSSRPMIGYYGGEAAESGNTISLRTPVINIYNENTLRAEVTYWIPRTLSIMGEAGNVALDVKLSYQDQELTLNKTDAVESYFSDISYISYTYTWTLDALQQVASSDTSQPKQPQFKELFSSAVPALSYGEDFTIIAEAVYNGDTLKVNGARKSATDNSLFAKGSSEETAYIACVRHLQNLDAAFSGVEGKTAAEQVGEIPELEDYVFQPIENEALRSYDGREFPIYGLDIRTTDGTPAGLFGQFSGADGARKELKNIRLVNTAASGSGYVGALVGNGTQLALTNCQVYWENLSAEQTNLRSVLGDSVNGFQYQIVGGSAAAGGLAGNLAASALTNCSASTLVKGNGSVGGLIGQGSALTVNGCYAASYLKGSACAGLVGNLTGACGISGSYAVGFIDSGTSGSASAAGLCLGSGTAAVKSSYSAMLFTAREGVANHPLCQSGSYDHTYYLEADQFAKGAQSVTYSDLTNPAKWNELFGEGVFASKGTAQSNPYNLQTTLSLTAFSYPGVAALAHWGDWGAQFQNGSLVYYERYTDGTYGFSGGDLSHLAEDKIAAEDGYAVAYRGTTQTATLEKTLKVTRQTGDNANKSATYIYKQDQMYSVTGVKDTAGKTENYYLLPLPAEVVNTEYTAAAFYQKITIEDVGEHTTQSYYFNPHFANPVLRYEDDLNPADEARQLQVLVRSARQLYMLSKYATYYASGNQYRFVQELDVDYTKYTGYELFRNSRTQAPIGLHAGSPFRGNYYGNCHIITGVSVQADDASYVGLFGYSTGVLQDIVYDMSQSDGFSVSREGSGSDILYVGALAGYNGGSVTNCAVYGVVMQARCFDYSTIYLGGLVGQNTGAIRSSAAEVAAMTADANLSNAYAGGFVGRNAVGGSVVQCYAVGKVTVSRARVGEVYACGFAGSSEGTLGRSYAAVSLTVSGEAGRYGFCPDSSTNCVYLNNGNFTYRDGHYAAQYEDSSATGVTWAELSGINDSEAVRNLGMQTNVVVYQSEETYPYPGIVQNAADKTIHYGQWPDQMKLGNMGVYYWEKLSIGNVESYHFSAISMVDGQAAKSGTLSTAHDDGGVVTEYGYGYFQANGTAVPQLTSQGIGYEAGTASFTPSAALENSEANKALSELMSGQYTFHSYNTWGTKATGESEGLYLLLNDAANRYNTEAGSFCGTWTLQQGDDRLSIRFSPFFADAMAQDGQALPGTADNPYQIRSIAQLQFINWNWYAQNTSRSTDGGNYFRFPYLSYGENSKPYDRSFYWEQTHDLDGSNVKDYTPIAALDDGTDAMEGDAYAWFSGSYDGNDYTIQQLSIVNKQNYNTTGLFGFTRDANLQNIILYSPDGSAVMAAKNSEDTWYGIGGLVGLAANTSESERTIRNCAVSGYTMIDANTGCAYGGGGVGGLVGICNMALQNCTAVTDIQLAFRHSYDNRNVRVGGVAGSCQQSITNCYSGGNISLVDSFDSDSAITAKLAEYGLNLTQGFKHDSISKLHVGGIVGGYYMKVLNMPDGKTIDAGVVQKDQVVNDQTAVRDYVPYDDITSFAYCYTYVTVEDAVMEKCKIGNSNNNTYYAIGGLGELVTEEYGYSDSVDTQKAHQANYTTCYYLSNVPDTDALDVNNSQNVQNCTYASLSGGAAAATLKQHGFSAVTTVTASGEPLSGRYSFGNDASLLGWDYPFPTILTQTSDVAADGIANVHYGDWPLEGIRRPDGALPVNLDLFADYTTENGGAVRKETLSLSQVASGGTWSAVSKDPKIAETAITQAGALTITAKKAGSTTVTVNYEVGGKPYSLDIDVNVTAELRLAAETSTVTAFTEETVTAALQMLDRDGKPLHQDLQNEIELSNPVVEFDRGLFSAASIQTENGLLFTADSLKQEGTNLMTMGYDFRYLENDYHATSVLSLEVVQPAITLSPLSMVFTDATAQEQTAQYAAAELEFALAIGEEEQQISDLTIAAFEAVASAYKDIVQVEWAKDENGKDIPGILSVTAYRQENPSFAAVRLQFRFTYAGVTHTRWAELEIQVKNQEPEPEPTEPEEPSEEETQP